MKKSFFALARHAAFAALMMVLFAGLTNLAHEQVMIRGRVTDRADGTVLPGAHVVVEESNLAAVADTAGRFILKLPHGGHYTIKASYVGYSSWRQALDIRQDTALVIPLETSVLLGDEVNIVATRALDKYPMAHSLVTNREIQSLNLGKDIPYLIQQTPSVIVTSDAGNGIGYTGINIRGTDLTRINVTVNGIPLNDAESQGVWFVDLPDIASSTGNIQVQRGVGTSTNGAGAFGASINFLTTDMREKAYGELDLSGGSFATFKSTLRFGTGLIKGHFSVDGRFSYIRSDGYIDRASASLRSYYLCGGYYSPGTTLRLITFSGLESTYQAWEGVPKDSLVTNRTYNPAGEYTDAAGRIQYYKNQTDNYQQDHYQLIYSQSLSDHFVFNSALYYTRGRGYYENYKQDASLAGYGLDDVIIGGDTITQTNLVNRKMMDNDFTGFTFSGTYTLPEKLTVIAGGGWNSYYGEHFGKVIWAQYASNGDNERNWYYNTGLKRDFNMYGKANYTLVSHLSLFADLQYRRVTYELEGTQDNLQTISQQHLFNFFNPKTGIFWTFREKNDLYGSFAVANREPSRNNYIDSDPGKEPMPERLYDYEIGYARRFSWSTWGINLYHMRYHDQLVLTGEINNVGEAVMVNVPKSYRTGVEITGTMDFFNHRLLWNVTATLSRNKIPDFTSYTDLYDADWNYLGQQEQNLGTTDLSFSPAFSGNSLLTWKPVKELALSLNSKYVGMQYIDNTSSRERSLDGYFINGFHALYTLHTRLFSEIGLNVAVNNLFNEKYETNGWVYPYYLGDVYQEANGYFPQAGINLLIGISLKL